MPRNGRSRRGASRGVAIAFFFYAIAELVLPRAASAAGYYNLGAFWRAPVAAPPSCQTIAFVQQVSNVGSTYSNAPVSAAITETAGNLLVAVVYTDSAIDTSFTVSDMLGHTWYSGAPYNNWIAGGDPKGDTLLQIYYAQNILAGANTVSVSSSTTPTIQPTGIMLLEYSGVALSAPVDISAGQISTVASGTALAGSMVTSGNCSELVVAAFADPFQFFTHEAGWTQQAYDGSYETIVQDNTPGLVASGSTVASTSFMNGGSDVNWVGTQLAFRAQGSAAPTQPVQLGITSTAISSGVTWQCTAMTIQAQNSSSGAAIAHIPIPVDLSSTSLLYFLDPGCSVPITSTAVYAGLSSQTIYVEAGTASSQTMTVSSTGLTSGTQAETLASLAPYTWVGGGGCDGLWTTASCWSGGVAPGLSSSNAIVFDTNCATHCVASLTGNTTVGSLFLAPGNVTELDLNGYNLTVSNSGATGNLTVWGQTLHVTPPSSILSVGGDVSISGGAISLNGTLQVQGNYSVTGGSFVATSTSTLILNDSSVGCNPDLNVNPGTVSYGNVLINDSLTCDVYRIFAAGSTMTVQGNLTLDKQNGFTGYLYNGTIAVSGNLVVQTSGYSGTTNIQLVGTSSQAVSNSGVGVIPGLTIASTGGTVTFTGNTTIFSNYVYTSGAVDFTTNSVTLTFSDTIYNTDSWSLVPGTINYYNVSFLDSNNDDPVIRTLPPGSTMNVTNNLLLDATHYPCTLNGGTISVTGSTVTTQALGCNGTTNIQLAGTTNQTLSTVGTTAVLPSLVFNNSLGATITISGNPTVFGNYAYMAGSGTVDFTTNSATLQFDDATNNYGTSDLWTITPGTVHYFKVSFMDGSVGNMPVIRTMTGTMGVYGTLLLNSSGNNPGPSTLNGGQINAFGPVTVQHWGYYGSTMVTVAGSANQTVDTTAAATGFMPSLKINSSGGTVTFNGNPQIFGNFEYDLGVVDFTTHSVTLKFNDPTQNYGTPDSWTIVPGTLSYNNVSFVDAPAGNSGVLRTLNPGSTMTIGGALVLGATGVTCEVDAGTFQVAGGVTVSSKGYNTTSNYTVTGGWTNSGGTFDATAGTVTFTPGVSHTITGANSFYNFTMDDSTVSTSDTLTFPKGKTQSIGGTLFLKGNATNNLSIVSSTATVAATLGMVTAPQTMGGFLTIQDNKPSGGKLHTGASSTLVSNFGATANIWVNP